MTLLESLAAEAPSPAAPKTPRPGGNGQARATAFDVAGYIAAHNINARGPEPWHGGQRWVFDVCPHNSDHTNGSAYILQMASGAVAHGCHHNGCAGKDWHALRDLVEPGWRDRGATRAPTESGGNEPSNNDLVPIAAVTLCRDHPSLRPPVIDGIIRQSETANLVASSKVGKTFLALDVALSVGSGRAWLGTFPVTQCRVLYIDCELHPSTMARRVEKVAAARNLTVADYGAALDILSLRGKLRDLVSLASFFEAIEPGCYGLIVLDALYRLLPRGCDENSNADITELYNRLDRYAEQTGAAFVVVHHASKGSQSGKSVTDTGSGAGAQSRAADTHLILRPHEEDDVVVLEAACRSFPAPVPICLRWDYPAWDVAPGLDPTNLRKNNRRESADPEKAPKPPKPVWDVPRFCVDFLSAEPRDKKLVSANAKGSGLSARKVDDLIAQGLAGGQIHKWAFSADRAVYLATGPQPITATGPAVNSSPETHTHADPRPSVLPHTGGCGGECARVSQRKPTRTIKE